MSAICEHNIQYLDVKENDTSFIEHLCTGIILLTKERKKKTFIKYQSTKQNTGTPLTPQILRFGANTLPCLLFNYGIEFIFKRRNDVFCIIVKVKQVTAASLSILITIEETSIID